MNFREKRAAQQERKGTFLSSLPSRQRRFLKRRWGVSSYPCIAAPVQPLEQLSWEGPALSAYKLGWGGTALRCFRVLTGFMLIGSDVKLNSPSSLISQALTEILQHPERARDALRVLLHLVRGAGPSGKRLRCSSSSKAGGPAAAGAGGEQMEGTLSPMSVDQVTWS